MPCQSLPAGLVLMFGSVTKKLALLLSSSSPSGQPLPPPSLLNSGASPFVLIGASHTAPLHRAPGELSGGGNRSSSVDDLGELGGSGSRNRGANGHPRGGMRRRITKLRCLRTTSASTATSSPSSMWRVGKRGGRGKKVASQEEEPNS